MPDGVDEKQGSILVKREIDVIAGSVHERSAETGYSWVPISPGCVGSDLQHLECGKELIEKQIR
jgi:hypothetical protein